MKEQNQNVGRESVQLDIAGNETQPIAEIVAATQKWAEKYSCRAVLVEECGPGGGNPLFEFYGSASNLGKLVTAYETNAI